jgi:hypothetical protein
MSEKPSALSTIPPQPPAEGEYDLICATMAESARGRWFLDEYARRNRNTDTAQVLGAIERIEAMIRGERDQQVYQSFRGDLLDMAKAIAQTRADVATIEPKAPGPATGAAAPAAPLEANRDIFSAAERIQDVAWTMRERGLDARISQQIEALASSILLASSLRNPDDHRTQKLGELLHYLERRINAMLAACAEPAQKPTAQQAPAPEATLSTDQISIGEPSPYQALPDEEVEAASAPPHGGNGHDPDGIHAVTLPDQEAPAAQTAEAPVSIPASVTIAAEPPPGSPAVLVSEEPAAPLVSAEPAAPLASEEPAAPLVLQQPAAPLVSVEPAAPLVSVEPAAPVVSEEPAAPLVLQQPAAPLASEEQAAPPAAEIAAVPVETERQPDPAPSTAVRATIPQIELEPLVVATVAWRKTPADEPPAELEHAPIPVEPLFQEQRAEAPAAASAPVIPLFRPPEAAVVFLVEYPTDDARSEAGSATAASVLEAAPLPERLPPVAAPEASVERSAVMIADTDKEPLVPAPADTAAASAPQSHAYSLPIAEPIPQPLAAPAAPPAAAAAYAPRDPLAALRAMTPEERIALFT